MKTRLISSFAAVLAGTGTALAQAPAAPAPAAPLPIQAATDVANSAVAASGCAGCDKGHADCDDDYHGAGSRFYFRGEYLLWDTRDQRLPSLMRNFPVPIAVPALGNRVAFNFTTQPVLPAGMSLNDTERSGSRLTLGSWFDADHSFGAEISFFQLERSTVSSRANQMNNLELNTPFFTTFSQTVPGLTQPLFTTVPSTLPGTLSVTIAASGSTRLWGAEANVRCQSCSFGGTTFELLGGFRYVDLRESLFVAGDLSLSPSGPLFVNGTPITIPASMSSTSDLLFTNNQFFGPQVGTSFETYINRLSIRGDAKIALGGWHQSVTLAGVTRTNDGTVNVGGQLVAPLDIGTHSRTRYGVVPELGVHAGYQLSNNLKIFVGYTFVYFQNVARPGDQIGATSNQTLIRFADRTTFATVQQPAFRFTERDIWAQGVNFGMEFRY